MGCVSKGIRGRGRSHGAVKETSAALPPPRPSPAGGGGGKAAVRETGATLPHPGPPRRRSIGRASSWPGVRARDDAIAETLPELDGEGRDVCGKGNGCGRAFAAEAAPNGSMCARAPCPGCVRSGHGAWGAGSDGWGLRGGGDFALGWRSVCGALRHLQADAYSAPHLVQRGRIDVRSHKGKGNDLSDTEGGAYALCPIGPWPWADFGFGVLAAHAHCGSMHRCSGCLLLFGHSARCELG